jgi:hypothetical protein
MLKKDGLFKTGRSTAVAIERSPDDIITRKELLRRLRGAITDKKFSELRAQGLIPEIDLGHRTKRYRESAVRAALISLESEVSA